MALKNILQIVIITYNRKEYLKNTLTQLFDIKSPVRKCDITVLDNASTDNTSNVVNLFCKKHKNLKYIKNIRNIGGNGNIIEAYKLASKDYIWVLCDDDTLHWDEWKKIEKALLSYYFDALILNPCENNLANIYYDSTFVPSQIYKTNLITPTVLTNMYCNTLNFFPHLAIMASVINNSGNIYTDPNHITVLRGGNENVRNSYVKDTGDDYLVPSRKNMFWFVGYINSIALLKNKKDKDYILDNTTHEFGSMFNLLTEKIKVNRKFYNNYLKNLIDIFYGLNTKWKLLFVVCYIRSLFNNKLSKDAITCVQDWEEYILNHNIINRANKIGKKYKNVVLYGIGMIVEAMRNNGYAFDNIKYLCDLSYEKNSEKYGVNTITVLNLLLTQSHIDCIMVAPHRAFREIKNNLRNLGFKCPIVKLIK